MKLFLFCIIAIQLCIIFRISSDLIEAKALIHEWENLCMSANKKADERFMQLFDECCKSQQPCTKTETPL